MKKACEETGKNRLVRMSKPLILGVAGGSGSGKTTVVSNIIQSIGKENVLLMQHDSYYRDLSHLPFSERTKQNFDHPASLETELMIRHLDALRNGYQVDIPVYDFVAHTRSEETISAYPQKIILVDGILIYSEPKLRKLMDIKIFVDTDGDVRLLRRLKRDISERGRDLDGVLNQYEKFVRPMHLEFVEPSKRYADIIIPRGGENTIALEMVIALIRDKLNDSVT
jgi:uridine kinase